MDFGAYSLIPPFIVIVLAIWLRSSFEALLIGCVVGFIMIARQNFFTEFVASLYKVMEDESTVWVILVCGLYGSLIFLMVKSGGAKRFGELALTKIKTKRAALMGTWGLGLGIFLDDYLSALTVGITMKKITDTFRVPREFLAYIVNTTAPPVCVIVPISTWSIFVGNILEKSNVAAKGAGLSAYIKMIPFISYGWISVFLIPFVIYGLIPVFGKMKLALLRAEKTGELIGPNTKVNSIAIEHFENESNPKVIYFLLPLAVLLAATVAFKIDALKGVMVAIVFTFIYYLVKKVGSFKELSESVFAGFNSMIFALALVVISYVLKDVGDKMGLTNFVIHSVKPFISKEFLPVIIFMSIGFISFATGSSWGVYAVVIPIVAPLAQSLGANVLLSCGAVVSAGVFGANACLFSDANILSSQSTDCNNVEHGLSQLPLALMAFALSCVAYLILGFAF